MRRFKLSTNVRDKRSRIVVQVFVSRQGQITLFDSSGGEVTIPSDSVTNLCRGLHAAQLDAVRDRRGS